MKILVVEDEAGIRNNLTTLLRLEGYTILDAANGRIGLEQARAHLPDLILSDVMMPELDGYSMLEQLRADPVTESIPLVFLTARSDRSDMRRGMNLGANDYLGKPFTRVELLDAIKATFKRNNTHENKALKQAISTLEDVGRIAQHDLKTPLGSLAAAPALLRAGRSMSAQEEAVLSMMELAANRAIRLVNLSLDIYRMETGTYLFRPEIVDLSAVVNAVVMDLAAQAQSKQIQITTQGHEPTVYVAAEDSLCYSIIANLTKNAVEAAPDGSVVRIHLHNDPRVRLVIHNQGSVPESMRGNFFAKYASSGKAGGSGLGTYSSHLLAQVQGGSLTMETSEAGGTCLTLELQGAADAKPVPEVSIAASALENAESSSLPQAGASPVKVLLVDDDDFNLMILSEYFDQPGISLSSAINGRLALQSVMNQWPHLIVMDMEMPIMDGMTAMLKIRDYQAGSGQNASCIVAFTGNDDATRQASYVAQGFDQCLEKPCTQANVLALLMSVQRSGKTL